jgi:shikimate kinase
LKRVLITGISGTGKSTLINELKARGYRAIDADYDGISETVSAPDDVLTGTGGGQDWVWREDRIQSILSANDAEVLFISGCSPNQGKFYPQFDHIVLLTAPVEVILERLATRTNNPYGKRPGEVARVLADIETVEPLLRKSAHHVVHTDVSLNEVVSNALRLVGE